MASLFASEAAIYGRYGYGVASTTHDLAVDTRAAQRWHASAPADPGRVRLSDDDELAALGPALFDAARRGMPGAVGRNAVAWRRLLERVPPAKGPDGPRVRAVHVGADGHVDGYARLRSDGAWHDGAPRYTVTVDDLTGTSPGRGGALWRFCLGMDLVTTLKAEHRGPGRAAPLLPVDTRAVRVVGEARRALVAGARPGRRAAGPLLGRPGRVVLEVTDPGGPAAGRWQLDVDEDGRAEVSTTTAAADVTHAGADPAGRAGRAHRPAAAARGRPARRAHRRGRRSGCTGWRGSPRWRWGRSRASDRRQRPTGACAAAARGVVAAGGVLPGSVHASTGGRRRTRTTDRSRPRGGPAGVAGPGLDLGAARAVRGDRGRVRAASRRPALPARVEEPRGPPSLGAVRAGGPCGPRRRRRHRAPADRAPADEPTAPVGTSGRRR